MGAVRRGFGRLSRRAAPLLLSGALLLPAACEHAQPFGAADLGPNVPFSQGFPRRLTFNPFDDLAPAWLPDGSGIIYSFRRLDRPDRDRCLGVLPAAGGRILRSICHRPALDADSTNALTEPAVGPGDLLAYVRESSLPGALAPVSRELVVATLGDPDPGHAVKRFPYVAPSGAVHQTASYVHWLDAKTLVYLAEQVTYQVPLGNDTVITPVEVAELTLKGDSAVVAVVPGTSGATSVAVDAAGSLYFTLAGDSRVFRIGRGGGSATAFYDFGALGPVFDVQVRGNVVIAVTGTRLYRADLAAGTVDAIPPPGSLPLLRPALSPAATRVVAQARDAAGADLWLFPVP